MDKAEKRELVSALNGVFSSTSVVVVAHYAGLTVSDMRTLRGKMRDAGGAVKVAKNRLAKLALQGTPYEHLGDMLTGPTVLLYSDDPVAAPKVCVDYAKANEKLVVLGGGMGNTALDPDGVKSLATLPSLDELRAKLIGLLTQPAAKVAQIAAAPGAQLARVINAYATKDEAA